MLTVTKELQHEMLRRMLRIRKFEEKIITLLNDGTLAGSAHLSIGEEAVFTGVCVALTDKDYITGTHRSHGHPIAKGAKVAGMMAEVFGRVTGVNRGKGGSMHLAVSDVGSLGETAIVGSGSPIACGAAMAAQIRGQDTVAVAFFGDGAANEGAVHESMNLAAIWKLPVIFVLENNGVAVSGTVERLSSVQDFSVRAAGYNIPGVSVDGQNVEAVYAAAQAAIRRARAGDGPSLLECKTYRFREHAEGPYFDFLSKTGFRDPEVGNFWIAQRDPIKLYTKKLLADGAISEQEYTEMSDSVIAEIEDAVKFAIESPFPDPSELYMHTYSKPILAGIGGN